MLASLRANHVVVEQAPVPEENKEGEVSTNETVNSDGKLIEIEMDEMA